MTYVLIDSKVGIGELDISTFKYLQNTATQFQVVLTKCDKINKKQREELLVKTEKELEAFAVCYPLVILTSTLKKKGIDELRASILKTSGLIPKDLSYLDISKVQPAWSFNEICIICL